MGLVVCLDCAGSVSHEAEACIHCGKPLMEQQTDIMGIVLTIAYATYLVCSGLFVSLRCLRAFVYFSEGGHVPPAMDVMIFLLWLISLSVGWMALKTAAKGPMVHRRLVVRDSDKSDR